MVTKNKTWESGIEILKSMFVNIPISILYACNVIADKVKGDEFSILTKIEKIVDDEIWISPDYYIPLQEVAVTSVTYLEDADAHNYNVVIHRHPNGMNNFSTVDKDYINQNFELSLLYTQTGGFVNGVYNMKYGKFLIPIGVTPNVEYDIPDIDISKITKHVYVSPTKYEPKDQYRRDWDNSWVRGEDGVWGPKKEIELKQLEFTEGNKDNKEDTKDAEVGILANYTVEAIETLETHLEEMYADPNTNAWDIYELEAKIEQLRFQLEEYDQSEIKS